MSWSDAPAACTTLQASSPSANRPGHWRDRRHPWPFRPKATVPLALPAAHTDGQGIRRAESSACARPSTRPPVPRRQKCRSQRFRRRQFTQVKFEQRRIIDVCRWIGVWLCMLPFEREGAAAALIHNNQRVAAHRHLTGRGPIRASHAIPSAATASCCRGRNRLLDSCRL